MTIVIDGGLSSALADDGIELTGKLWTARLLADDPEAIVRAHLAFLQAGALVIITSSYQASVDGFVDAGLARHDAATLISSSTALALEARRQFEQREPGAARQVRVAASVGPYGAVLGDGSEYDGHYDIDDARLLEFHRSRLALLVDSGPDLLAVETIPSASEARIIIEALAEHRDQRAWISFSCRDGSSTCASDPFEQAVAVAASSPQVVAIGVNCTAPDHVAELLARARTVTDRALVAYPNSGQRWDAVTKAWQGSPIDLAVDGQLDAWLAAGASLVGGCCGIGPAAIGHLADRLRRAQP